MFKNYNLNIINKLKIIKIVNYFKDARFVGE